MRKFLLLLLSVVFALPLVACANTKSSQENKEMPAVGKPARVAIDTFIQDSNGVDKCFWEDGKVSFDDWGDMNRQTQKSATLSMQTEYDMWFNELGRDFDFVNYYDPPEFECGENIIEVKPNPDKENHFILKVLQPCENEKIRVKIIGQRRDDRARFPSYVSLTISTEE